LFTAAHARVVAVRDDIAQAVVDDDLDLDVGLIGQQLLERGPQYGFGRMLAAVMRMVPAGLSRSARKAASSTSISSSRGPTDRRRRAPASVGATRRVVRAKSRIPSRSSSARTVWLNADCDTPSFAAALVKLPSRATVMQARRSLRVSRRIHDPSS
jgi:hypothetical protein